MTRKTIEDLASEMTSASHEIQQSLIDWRTESARLQESIRPLAEYLRSVDQSMKVIADALAGTARFVKFFLPWICAICATLLGISPSIIKTVLAANGHPAP